MFYLCLVDVPVFRVTAPTEAAVSEQRSTSRQSRDGPSPDPEAHTETGDGQPAIKLAPVNSASSPWSEEMDINWTRTVARDDLLSLRDFLRQGMAIHVVEEKVKINYITIHTRGLIPSLDTHGRTQFVLSSRQGVYVLKNP